MPKVDWSPSDEADIRSLNSESPLAQALAGGERQRVGWFRLYFDDERWEWSPEVERMHGYEPGTVRPTTALVLSHKHPEDYEQVAATLDEVRRTHEPFSTRHRIIDVQGRASHAGTRYSGTVASSTPVRISVSLCRGPRATHLFERCGCYWGTSEVKEEPEEIPDTAHELVLERVCAIDVAKDSWPDPEISFDSGPEGYTAAPS